MSLTLRNDPAYPIGGHALLEGPELKDVTALAIEDLYSGLYLTPGRTWAKQRTALAVTPVPGAVPTVRLGPEIVNAIPEDARIAFHDPAGTLLDRVFWVDIIVSPGELPANLPPPRPGAADRPPPLEVVPPPPPPSPPAPPAKPEPVVPATPIAPPTPVTTVVRDDFPPIVAPAPKKPSRRGVILALIGLAVLVIGGGAVYTLFRPRPPIPVPDRRDLAAAQCTQKYASSLSYAALEALSDDERVTLTTRALDDGCGAQAFQAIDGANTNTNEPAAWYKAQFYDPNQTAEVYRRVALQHADWAAQLYRQHSDAFPRDADALGKLCKDYGASWTANGPHVC